MKPVFKKPSAIAAAILASSILSHAAIQTWDGVTASWNTANWDSGNTWTAGNEAVVNAGKVELDSLWDVSALTINGGEVAQTTFPDPFGFSAPTVIITVNMGGTLSAAMGCHLGPITMAGGDLTGAGNVWGSWWFKNTTLTANGSTISTLSATNMVLQTGSTNTFSVDAGSGLNVTGTFASATNVASGNWNTGALVKTGAGTMTLSGDNNYKGATQITQGTLAFSGTSSGGNLQVNGSGAKLSITGGATTANLTGGDTYVVGGGTMEIAGGTLTLQGAGTYFSVGANTSGSGDGTVTISGGNLNANTNWGTTVGAIAGVTGTVNVNGGTFTANDGINSGLILGEKGGQGIVNLNSGGTLIVDAIKVAIGTPNTGTGLINFNGGTFQATGDVATVIAAHPGLTANVLSGGFIVDGTQNMTIAQALVDGGGNGGLTKNGSGTLTLTGVNTYTGNTVVNEGVLSLQNACIHDASSVTIATGAMMDLNFSGSDTVASVTLGNTTYTTPGSYDATTFPDFFTGGGSLVISGANDYATWSGPSGYNLAEGPDGDDDKDGMTNREEYAFGLVPTGGSSSNPITSPPNMATGQFTYTRRDPVTKNTGLTYTIWTSTDLTNWNPESNSSAVQTPGTPDGNGIQSVVVSLTPIPTAPKLFIQVRAN